MAQAQASGQPEVHYWRGHALAWACGLAAAYFGLHLYFVMAVSIEQRDESFDRLGYTLVGIGVSLLIWSAAFSRVYNERGYETGFYRDVAARTHGLLSFPSILCGGLALALGLIYGAAAFFPNELRTPHGYIRIMDYGRVLSAEEEKTVIVPRFATTSGLIQTRFSPLRPVAVAVRTQQGVLVHVTLSMSGRVRADQSLAELLGKVRHDGAVECTNYGCELPLSGALASGLAESIVGAVQQAVRDAGPDPLRVSVDGLTLRLGEILRERRSLLPAWLEPGSELIRITEIRVSAGT